MSKDNTLDERIEKILALYTQQQLAEHPYATSQPYEKATEAIKSLIAEEVIDARIEEREATVRMLKTLAADLSELEQEDEGGNKGE